MPRYGNIDKIKQRETRSQVYKGGSAIGVVIRDLDFLEDYASSEDSHLVTGPQLERLERYIDVILNRLDGCQDSDEFEVQNNVVEIKALLVQIRERQ